VVSRRRFVAFATVGVVGFFVQVSSLVVFVSVTRWQLLVATAASVAVAALHNFVWHERWTWADRTRDSRGWPMRLVRFGATNGVASLAGNVGFVSLYSFAFHAPPLVATVLAVISMTALNFVLADRLVFGETR
jgi:putative flippase GtrA